MVLLGCVFQGFSACCFFMLGLRGGGECLNFFFFLVCAKAFLFALEVFLLAFGFVFYLF